MKKMILMTVALAAMAAAGAEGKKDPWEDFAVNSINRLPARTYSMPLADVQSALTDDLEPVTPYKMSLNGDWKIKWTGDPARRPADFWKTDFDDSGWETIDVPSCVEMRGYGTPGYTNVRYPHKDTSQPKDKDFGKILDRDTGAHDNNPVSSYRRTFTVPEGWAGRDVILRFDGVYSAYNVWVNGKFVGYAEDSKLPSEFDITSFLNPDTNLIAVEVFRWCDGSYLEDQDMFRFSGIFRDVTLWAKPKDGIWDFAVKASADGRLEVDVDGSKVKKSGEGEQRISISLYDADGKKVGDLASSSASTYALHLSSPRLWSAEDPYLYTLVVKKGEDIRMRRVGFKDQKIDGSVFKVNGQAIKFKGVNRHETNPENGRTVSLDDMLADITLMKRYNINTVRTSHYPDHHLWYDLCDRYGIYLVAEANVEGHEPGYWEGSLGKFPEYDHTIVERNERHVVFCRNHPSVTLWSLGNETGHGDCFRHAIERIRAIDPSRPIHWERGNADADVDSKMYPSVEWLEGRGRIGDGGKAELKSEEGGAGFVDADQTPGKCFFMCEYAHAMGNAIGNFDEYWQVYYAHPSLAGGCIWDWIDQAVWKPTGRVDQKTGTAERYLAYGGDFDEEPNDGPFCCNGVIGPNREVTPKLVEVGHVHRNLVVREAKAGGYELENRFGFTYADQFDGAWSLIEDGVEVASGKVAMPHLAPLTRGALVAEGLEAVLPTLDPKKEHFVNFAFATKTDSLWAKKGWIVARDQLALVLPEPPAEASAESESAEAKGPAIKMGVEETAERVTVEIGRTTAIFDRKTGTLSTLIMKGVTVIDDPAPGICGGPQLTFLRAFTDNDRWMRDGGSWGIDRKKGINGSGLLQPRYHPGKIVVSNNTVKTVVDVTGAKGAGFIHETDWNFAVDGTVELVNRVTPYGRMPEALPRLGLSMRLPLYLEHLRYYGRGPWENYCDRKTASFVGIYESTVRNQFVDYVRPQDNGGKSDVRWIEITDKHGRGARFSASEPLFVQALHYGWEDLEFARFENGARRHRTPLVPRDEVCLNLDVRQTGLGGASCGPVPMDKYRFDPNAPVNWTLKIESVRRDIKK